MSALAWNTSVSGAAATTASAHGPTRRALATTSSSRRTGCRSRSRPTRRLGRQHGLLWVEPKQPDRCHAGAPRAAAAAPMRCAGRGRCGSAGRRHPSSSSAGRRGIRPGQDAHRVAVLGEGPGGPQLPRIELERVGHHEGDVEAPDGPRVSVAHAAADPAPAASATAAATPRQSSSTVTWPDTRRATTRNAKPSRNSTWSAATAPTAPCSTCTSVPRTKPAGTLVQVDVLARHPSRGRLAGLDVWSRGCSRRSPGSSGHGPARAR